MKKLLIVGITLLITGAAQAKTKEAAAVTPAPQIQPATKPPVVDTLVFSAEAPEQVGVLTWRNGKFEFQGKADKAARVFFEKYLRQIVDDYLKEKGCPGK